MGEYIERGATCKDCLHYCVCKDTWADENWGDNALREMFSPKGCENYRPAADAVEVDKVAEMLRLSFGDDCACNFNGNDEWMWEKCKYAEMDCPYPKDDNGCWKEFVKHFIAKMDGKGDGE